MLRRFLAISALALSTLVVSADNIEGYARPDSFTADQGAQPYTLHLSCTQCAFSYGECRQNNHPPSYLSITFSTQNDALLANNDIIFPTPIPRKFRAQRHWDSAIEPVPVAYTLEVEPLPSQPSVLGDLYILHLALVDLQGRTATYSAISVFIVRDAEGNLHILQVEESGRKRSFRNLPHRSNGESEGEREHEHHGNWWHLEAWRSRSGTYINKGSGSRHCVPKSVEVDDDMMDVRVDSNCHHHRYDRLSKWAGDRHYMRFLRPVILPALLGLAAAVVAWIVGYFVGRVIATAFYFCRPTRRRSQSQDRISENEMHLEEVVVDEKERLMDVYGGPESDKESGHS